jgi:hypothetical protein
MWIWLGITHLVIQLSYHLGKGRHSVAVTECAVRPVGDWYSFYVVWLHVIYFHIYYLLFVTSLSTIHPVSVVSSELSTPYVSCILRSISALTSSQKCSGTSCLT